MQDLSTINVQKTLEISKESKLYAPSEFTKLQELAKNPTTVGMLEFITGLGATAFNNPGSLFISGGHLAQALCKGKFVQQLYDEVQKYRKEGAIPEENLESAQGKTLFVELLRIVDEETLDDTRFSALKDIFLKSIWKGSNEQTQMLGYQYFQVCKKLSSMDILVLKTAFNNYKKPGSNQRGEGIQEWEVSIAKELGFPRELVTQSRIRNSPINQTSNTLVFDAENGTRHGLTPLGIAIGEYIEKEI